MKLTAETIDRTLDQLTGQAIPENHPATERFAAIFGDHTFFLDDAGLKIVEPAEPQAGEPETGRVVKLASWANEARTSLAPHEWEFTDIVIPLDRAA